MATIDGYTKAKMDEINDKTVVDARIDGSGHLILDLRDTTTIDAGSVIGPTGPMGSDSPGDLKCSIRTTPEAGWLHMNGQVINNADTLYPALWAVVPEDWISGTTMTLPNMAETVAQGAPGTVGGLGDITGANTKGISASQLPPHSHTGPSHKHAGGLHTHAHAHDHGIPHTHMHQHGHTDTLGVTINTNTAVRNNAAPGNFNSLLAANDGGTDEVQTNNPISTGTITGAVGNTTSPETGQPTEPETGPAQPSTTSAAGAVDTSLSGTGPTGMGPGINTPFDVQQRALLVNWFIKT
jgi:hypothetical protein